MWDKIVTVFQSATSFLQSGKTPPNTPVQYHDEFSKINFFSSKKFFVVFSSVILLMVFCISGVVGLFLTATLSEVITTSFVTIFVESLKVFTIIITAYLGLQATIDFKYQSSSENLLSTSVSSTEEKIIKEETIKYANQYKDDPSYAPINWVFNQPTT